MGFRRDAYACCWSVEEGKGNSLKVRLSTSRKKDGEYEQDFSGFCTFIGEAKKKGAKLKPKDRIKLGDVDVTTWYNREKETEYVAYKVFDFEMVSTDGTPVPEKKKAARTEKKSALDEIEGDESEEAGLPF